MQHVITVKDVLEVSGVAVLIFAVIGGILWFISTIDFSH